MNHKLPLDKSELLETFRKKHYSQREELIKTLDQTMTAKGEKCYRSVLEEQIDEHVWDLSRELYRMSDNYQCFDYERILNSDYIQKRLKSFGRALEASNPNAKRNWTSVGIGLACMAGSLLFWFIIYSLGRGIAWLETVGAIITVIVFGVGINFIKDGFRKKL